MFSSRLTRVAHRATATPSLSTTPAPAAHRTTAQCIAAPSSHQRRPSSSKASCPPDSSSKPSPAAKAAGTDGATQSPASAAAVPRRAKRSSRVGRLQGLVSERYKSKGPVDQFAGLPAVPRVSHLTEKDLSISSFFSMYRPISVTTAIPPPSTPEAFNNIFESRQERDPWENGNSAERRPEDVIYTLHNTIEALEANTSTAQDEGVRWEVIQESPTNNHSNVTHLDGAPPKMKSLEELVAQFKPFTAPPPPQPFETDDRKASDRTLFAKQKKQHQAKAKPQQKSYQTTITVLELTDPDGHKSYSASSSPIVRVPGPGDPQHQQSTATLQDLQAKLSAHINDPPRRQQPFLERMRRRQRMYLHSQHARLLARMGDEPQRVIRRAPSAKRLKMILISVKRQRKLKMKKHKYKKLMKRTRNLRRRQDRA